MSRWLFFHKPFLKAYPMATSTTKSTPMTTQQELKAAAELVLKKEEKRIHRAEMRARRQRRKREKEQLAAVQHMQQSIEVMKWCIVGIAAVMFLGIVIAVWVLVLLNSKVHEVQADLDELRPGVEEVVETVERVVVQVGDAVDEVARVREALRNPMESIGGSIGRNLDSKIQTLISERLGPGEE